MNVFTDLHHGDLFFSLHLLFEKRLGGQLFRPIGHDWFKKGFWKIAEPYGNAPDTIGQYLDVPPVDKPAQKYDVQKYGETQLIDDVYHIPCKVSNEYYVQKAITFDKFLEMDFDFVVSTYMGHDETYARLVQQYKLEATYIKQLGNTGVVPRYAKNVLSAVDTPMPSDVNYILYHPEHHRDYCYTPPTNHNIIKNFRNCLPHDLYDLGWWNRYERILPNFIWKMHGIDGRDGVISNDKMPEVIKDSAFVWHVKQTGCGGFVPRQAMACGRPVIIKSRSTIIFHTLVRDIYEDGVNCIDLDLSDGDDNISKIRYWSEPNNHIELCKSTAKSFNEKVNFKTEGLNIQKWLDKIRGT